MVAHEQTKRDLDKFIQEMIESGAMNESDIELVTIAWYTSSTRTMQQMLEQDS